MARSIVVPVVVAARRGAARHGMAWHGMEELRTKSDRGEIE